MFYYGECATQAISIVEKLGSHERSLKKRKTLFNFLPDTTLCQEDMVTEISLHAELDCY